LSLNKAHVTKWHQIGPFVWEISILTPDDVKFGAHIQTNGRLSHEGIMDFFEKNRVQFFIDVEVVSVQIEKI